MLALRSLVDDDTVAATDMGRLTFGWRATTSPLSHGSCCSATVSRLWASGFRGHGGEWDISRQEGGGGRGRWRFSLLVDGTGNSGSIEAEHTVIVFRDGGYNMVAFQQQLIYGRTSGTDLEIRTS